MAPTARKNACASDSRPVVPTSRLSPIAPTIAVKTANPVRSQNSSTYSGSSNRTTRNATRNNGRSSERRDLAAAGRVPARVAPCTGGAVVSDTGQLLGAEEPGRPDQEDGDHDDVRDDVTEAAAEEQQLVLVAGGERLGQPDQQAADQRPSGRVEAAEDRGGGGPPRDGVGPRAPR